MSVIDETDTRRVWDLTDAEIIRQLELLERVSCDELLYIWHTYPGDHVWFRYVKEDGTHVFNPIRACMEKRLDVYPHAPGVRAGC